MLIFWCAIDAKTRYHYLANGLLPHQAFLQELIQFFDEQRVAVQKAAMKTCWRAESRIRIGTDDTTCYGALQILSLQKEAQDIARTTFFGDDCASTQPAEELALFESYELHI